MEISTPCAHHASFVPLHAQQRTTHNKHSLLPAAGTSFPSTWIDPTNETNCTINRSFRGPHRLIKRVNRRLPVSALACRTSRQLRPQLRSALDHCQTGRLLVVCQIFAFPTLPTTEPRLANSLSGGTASLLRLDHQVQCTSMRQTTASYSSSRFYFSASCLLCSDTICLSTRRENRSDASETRP